jgi:heat-inducible transcriptional repressor
VAGSTLAAAKAAAGAERADPLGPVLTAAARALADMASPREPDPDVYMGGSSRLAEAFDAVETVRSVLTILEHQLVVVNLLRDILDRGLSVAIGTEHGYEPLSSCAVVVAPVSMGDHEVGAVGLLGPTRMNYPEALAAAHVVGVELSQRLDHPRARTRGDEGKGGGGDH